MQIKRYVASSIKDAVTRVKSDLGENAVILHTRRFRERSLLGLGGIRKVEILAGVEQDEKKLLSVEKELAELKKLLQKFNNGQGQEGIGGLPAAARQTYCQLLDAGIREDIIQEVLMEFTGKVDRTLLQEKILQNLPPARVPKPPKRGGMVIAVVGPSGSGKTSVLMRLAARFNIVEGVAVGLITTDNHRVAATEQFENYGEALGLPVEVALTPRQFKRSLEVFKDKKVILVDTAGRNPFQTHEMRRLEDSLPRDCVDELLLVLSLNTREDDLFSYAQKYRQLEFDGYVFTKLDESQNRGSIINLTWCRPEYLSYMTRGQNVLEGLEVIKPQKILEEILGDE